MDAIIDETSLAAESLGLAKTIGALAAGYEVDIIAVAGNPGRGWFARTASEHAGKSS